MQQEEACCTVKACFEGTEKFARKKIEPARFLFVFSLTAHKIMSKADDPVSCDANLKSRWKFSFQLYGGWSFADSETFDTAQQFWDGMYHLPNMSQLLRTSEGPREAFLGEDRQNVRGIILSRKDVVLEWKYPGLSHIYQYEEKDLANEEMDSTFENFCVDALGERYPSLLGLRLLDRSKKDSVAHRWEFWCSGGDALLRSLVEGKPNGKVQVIGK